MKSPNGLCFALPRRVRVTILALILAALIVPSALAQDRRVRTPGLVLETGAPTAAIQQILFTQDGKHLLIAGDDKVVRQWPLGDDGKLDRTDAQTFRWAIYREQRGSIYTMALSTDREQKHIALGGFGLRNGSLCLIDRTTGRVVAGVTQPGQGAVVNRVAFSPSGQEVAFGTSQGTVHVWKPFEGPNDLRQLGDHGPDAGRMRGLSWPQEDRLVSVSESGALRQWNPQQAKALVASAMLSLDNVRDTAISPDGRTLAATGQRIVGQDIRFYLELRSLADGETLSKPLRQGIDAFHLAFNHLGDTLAISMSSAPHDAKGFFTPRRHTLSLYDLTTGEFKADNVPAISEMADCLAFSPDGDRLAVAGGNDYELQLWDFKAKAVVDTVRSPGASIWQVGLSQDSTKIGFRQQRARDPSQTNAWGQGDWRVFDLARRNRIEDLGQQEFNPVLPQESQQWAVEAEIDNAPLWYVRHRATGQRYAVPLLYQRDGIPQCYTFLKARGGQPERLVVGHKFGMSVFSLSPGRAPVLARKYVGHQGEVVSVAPSADGTMLVTGSRDQTISAWSLADWPSPYHRELGASFELRDGELSINGVAAGSPAWEAGLTPGDVVVRLAYANKLVEGGPSQWSRAINTSTSGNELYFEVRRPNQVQPVPLLTTGRQRPVWCFFPTREQEWIIWRWRDFFYDCSVRGDELVGWQMSIDVDETPQFTRAEQNRQRFHNPRKLDDVLSALLWEKANLEQIAESQLVQPQVKLALERDADGVLLAMVEAQANDLSSLSDPLEVTLWINDHKYRQWKRPPLPFKQSVRITAEDLRHGANHIFCQAYSQYAVRADSKEALVSVDLPSRKPRLLGLCIGIADYPDTKEFNSLTFPGDDAREMLKALQRQEESGAFAEVHVETLVNAEASRGQIIRRLQHLASIARPDDQFVLYMSGHGWAQQVGASSRAPQTFTFVLPHFSTQNRLNTGLPFCLPPQTRDSGDETVYELLAKMPCHKLVMLDCCHSGGSTQMIRDLTPDGGVGPVIMVACDKDQLAWELPKGNGAFTSAVLDALGDNFDAIDADQDGMLDAAEMDAYLQQEVATLIEIYRPFLEKSLASLRTSNPQVLAQLVPIRQNPQVFTPRQGESIELFRSTVRK